jgi:hypothetical protein
MRKRGAGHFHPALYLLDALALHSGAHQEAEDLQPARLSQGVELFDVTIQYDISSIIEISLMQGAFAPERRRARSASRSLNDLTSIDGSTYLEA